jgi:CspA family cold shock protein
MATGTCKWFNAEKGFGFIVPDTAGQDIFVHVSALRPGDTLSEKDHVSFDIGSNRGKSCAVNVQIIT